MPPTSPSAAVRRKKAYLDVMCLARGAVQTHAAYSCAMTERSTDGMPKLSLLPGRRNRLINMCRHSQKYWAIFKNCQSIEFVCVKGNSDELVSSIETVSLHRPIV